MIELRDLRDNLNNWKAGMSRRGFGDVDLNALLKLADQRDAFRVEIEQMRSERNRVAKIGDVRVGAALKEKLAKLESEFGPIEQAFQAQVLLVPNLPMPDVPAGREENNQIISKIGEPPKIDSPKDHIELGMSLGVLDIERAAKASGSRFYYLKGQAVELEFALVRWVMDLLIGKGFELMVPPQLVSEKTMSAGGYLGRNAEEVYKVQDDLYLIGTSEQSVLGYHMDEIIEPPRRYAAFSTCFRREAGSYGKDVKGIIRTHQFDKVEMFSFVEPKDSAKELEMLVGLEEEILKGLDIPYQKVLLAAGDLGTPSAKTIDLESWLPSQKRYRETHSASNCTDWQARRANIRFKDEAGKNQYVHTLNGTAIAIGRTLVALMENYQQSDGSIRIPKVLHSYLSFKEIK
ncbi:serine--tRNA ligase [candidate division Kazan bacterium RBG_13_50_9]|uniref:Serine--tRNA ligase n=1 Tax=candidate division Kazan bacterium RBG_13_50_9 TaxID=1798535 RepID=A0A1F4NRN6_UNCK3|nr:MAG: serine--tRNA ligase [candidate division Kazan bacterium RBG_13_50_9]